MRKRLATSGVVAAFLALGSPTPGASGGMDETRPLPPVLENQEMRVLTLDWAPGHESPPHRHNAHVFVYVLEGTIEMQVRGGPLTALSPGDTFYETPDDVHVVSRNASATEPAPHLAEHGLAGRCFSPSK